jgi:ribonuclease G
MKQEVLVTRDKWQTQVAVVEDGRLVEFHQEPAHLDGLVGNLYVGRVSRILAGMESAFIDVGIDRDGFLYEGDMGPAGLLYEEAPDPGAFKSPSIRDLREGDRILVQVTKEPMGPKGARLSTQISLPGHFLIYLPLLDHVGVSRKIGGGERVRLKEAVRRIKGEQPGGFIARTAAEGATEDDLVVEMQALADLWGLVGLRSQRCEAPALVHQEADLVGRTVREILVKGDGFVVTDDAEVAEQCRETLAGLGIAAGRVRQWPDRGETLFDHYHVELEIAKALRPRYWLPSGGCIVIQSTEALVAIDVNSGRYTGKRSLEETAFAINMEAVEEIVRQIRLRSLGGIIVIDFIDMTKRSHKEALIARLNEALKRDHAKARILNISEFGLVEMTRKRSHRNLERVMTSVCPCCEGRGRLPAAWHIAQRVAGAVEGLRPPRSAVVTVSPEVARYIEENRERLRLPDTVRVEPMAIPQPSQFSIRPVR